MKIKMPRVMRGIVGSYRQLFCFGAMAGALFVSGCATPMKATEDADFQARAYTADRPVVRPTRAISSFSDSLMCMDQLFRNSRIPTTLITSKQIPDLSTRVAVATKDMIITSLSQMSRLSNAFRYVDYEVQIVSQDTVQNMTTILLNNNQMQLQRPALYISGAVAFVDQGVINNRFDGGVSGAHLEAGYSRNRHATVIGLELHLGDFRTRTLIPGLDSANEVIIGSGGQGLDLAGRIGSYGVHFNVGRDYSVGTGGAIRTLVDLAMIELLGKWARVPYWQCLTLEQTHPSFQRELRDWYDADGPLTQRELVRGSLINQGYQVAQANQKADDEAFRNGLAKFQTDNGMVVTGVVDFPTYERVLRNFVSVGQDGKLTRVGWNPTAVVPAVGTGSSLVTATNSTPQTRTIDLQIRNVLVGRSAFDQGEQVFLSASVSRASHFYCYYSDASGSLIRLLPNAANPYSLVSANQAIRIPDWMSPNPAFILDAGKPGMEGVACLATDDEAIIKLPPELMGPALVPIKDQRGLESVNEAFAKVFGRDGYTASAVQWEVVPKRDIVRRP